MLSSVAVFLIRSVGAMGTILHNFAVGDTPVSIMKEIFFLKLNTLSEIRDFYFKADLFQLREVLFLKLGFAITYLPSLNYFTMVPNLLM